MLSFRVISGQLPRNGGYVDLGKVWEALWVLPSITDVIGVVGVVAALLAALKAASTAEAVQQTITSTTQKIATAHLREAFDALRRLSISLDQAIKDDDKQGARYVLVWIAQESGRCVALLPRTGVPDKSKSEGVASLSELLQRLSTASLDAKSKLYSPDQRAKLTTVTRSVKEDLDALSLDLVMVTTHIGYGMEVDNV